MVALSTSIAMAQPPQGKQPSAEERVEQLKESLDLSDEQTSKILELQENRKMPERGDREAMKKMMEQEKSDMKEILTEEQYEKWEEMLSKQRPGGRPQR